VATLTRRDVPPAGLQRAWVTLTAAWALLLCATIAGIVVSAPGAHLWWLIIFPFIGGGELALFYWVGKRSMAEAEPSAGNETAEIQAARARLRDIKLYGWFGVESRATGTEEYSGAQTADSTDFDANKVWHRLQ